MTFDELNRKREARVQPSDNPSSSELAFAAARVV
jgi:hypothetical protein